MQCNLDYLPESLADKSVGGGGGMIVHPVRHVDERDALHPTTRDECSRPEITPRPGIPRQSMTKQVSHHRKLNLLGLGEIDIHV